MVNIMYSKWVTAAKKVVKLKIKIKEIKEQFIANY